MEQHKLAHDPIVQLRLHRSVTYSFSNYHDTLCIYKQIRLSGILFTLLINLRSNQLNNLRRPNNIRNLLHVLISLLHTEFIVITTAILK